VRWIHVVTGIVWIGTSFHLFSWEYKFYRGKGIRPEVAGSLWMIQGGDFYHIERLKKEPGHFPEQLVWFKYEAYFTWLSGFALLVFAYHINARGMLVDPSVSGISPQLAVAVSLASMPLCWLAYQGYCRTRLAGNLPLSAAVGFVAISLLAYLFSILFGGRAAFLHLGIVMGTIMSANVFFVIIPWHKALIRAIKAKQPLDALYARHPGVRSDHNHYLALPVVFVMLSSHLSIAHTHPLGWLVISLCILAAGLVKHAHSLLQLKRLSAGAGFIAAGLVLFVAAMAITRTDSMDSKCVDPVAYTEVREILDAHCTRCHSATPADPAFVLPPNNVVFDSAEEIDAMRERILYRAVTTRTMPPLNTTHMTNEDRALLGCWSQRRQTVSSP